jgi:S1-C subfamily serine protease
VTKQRNVIDFTLYKVYSIGMEHLTKQQIVLLTLLVSFMTSIATGIVTVSLINQAPAGTTNTVERIIQDTVASALPSSNLAAVGQPGSSSGGSLTTSIDTISKSIVKVGEYAGDTPVSGLGVVVNARGTVMTDKSVIAGLNNDGITYPNGKSYRAVVIQLQTNGDLVFLDPVVSASNATSTIFVPASIGTFPKLGEAVASLGGSNADTLGVGVVDQIITAGASSTPTAISTTIDSSKVLTGSPLFDLSGAVIGIQTSSLSSKSGTEFYPITPVKSAFPR